MVKNDGKISSACMLSFYLHKPGYAKANNDICTAKGKLVHIPLFTYPVHKTIIHGVYQHNKNATNPLFIINKQTMATHKIHDILQHRERWISCNKE